MTWSAEAECAPCALEALERLAPHAVLLDVRLGDEFEHCEESIARSGARGFVRKSRLAHTDLAQFWPLV